ncbi:NAD(P)-dependent alcohol dehydrogenase [Cryptosporangium sp. NPDC048952]|uniref:NAD(P)-dependent alcohol dehydrogenase n=1 Tax=Cryptosporangium sp. NPDC048952 TaxID=3363961 RepID=UPI003714B354
MKAIVQDRYGSSDVLELRTIDTPAPGENEVLVRVHAAAINAYDWHFMRGDPYVGRVAIGWTGPRKRVRGRDFAGTVEVTGAAVSRFRPGDEVYGEADGTLAEYVRVPAKVIEHKPVNLSFEQAAAVPLAGTTALKGLRDAGKVGPGQRVLINGASGGVGTFAIQIAKACGADVTGVCSARNVELLESLGADHVFDYGATDFARGDTRYDVIFDVVSNRKLAEYRRALTPNGTLVLLGGGPSNGGSFFGPLPLILRALAVSPFVSQRLVPFTVRRDAELLSTLRDLIEAGAVAPVIDRVFPLDQAPEAIRYLEEVHARAKVVVTV